MAKLRVLFKSRIYGTEQEFSLFDGDIKKDKIYWKKHQNVKARYFKLVELTKSHNSKGKKKE